MQVSSICSVIGAISLSFASASHAALVGETVDVLMCEFKTQPARVAFSNGIQNTPGQAFRAFRAAHASLVSGKVSVPEMSDKEVSVAVARNEAYLLYHSGDSIGTDLAEVLLAKAREAGSSNSVSIEDVLAAYRGEVRKAIDPVKAGKAMLNFVTEFISRKPGRQVDIEGGYDYQKIRGLLRDMSKGPILLVAHSQGTLAANAVFAEARRMAPYEQYPVPLWDSADQFVAKRLKVVNVGAAAADVAGVAVGQGQPFNHVTSSKDHVINALREASAKLALRPALAANSDVVSTAGVSHGDWWLNHGFVETYLSNTRTTSQDGLTSNMPSTLNTMMNRSLESVQVERLTNTRALEVQVEVSASRVGGADTCDSSCLGGSFPLGPLGQHPWEFPTPAVAQLKMPGRQTVTFSFRQPCSQMAKFINLRPDSPDRFRHAAPFNARVVVSSGRLDSPVTLHGARMRVVSNDGSPPSDWRNVDISNLPASSSLDIPLFSYRQQMTLQGLRLRLN